jgi:alpha-amylase
MAAVVFYFHVHQPYRIKEYPVFSIGADPHYFDTKESRLNNQAILKKVALKCYLPTNQLLLDLLHRHPDFKLSFSITGVLLDQMKRYTPEVLESFKRLTDTGRVEILAETYYHSLASLYSKAEFKRQIDLHQAVIKEHFGLTSTAFRNTELIYHDELAKTIETLGYKAIIAEGVDRYLGWRSPNFVYTPPNTKQIRLLLKNYRLSDDIAFRFSNKGWAAYPLTAEKFASWVSAVNGNGQVVNLFMDYETFGEHQWSDTGIFDFLFHLPNELKKHPDNRFMTVTEAALAFDPADSVSMPDVTSWADLERDLSAWIGNAMQHNALNALYALETDVMKTNNQELIESWRRLTTSDHFYYMCTKWFSDGDVHKYFSPNKTPYEAFVNFMNILHDVRQRVYASNRQTIINNQKKRSAHALTHSASI